MTKSVLLYMVSDDRLNTKYSLPPHPRYLCDSTTSLKGAACVFFSITRRFQMIVKYLEDDQFKVAKICHVRNTVRCFVMNELGQCAMILIKGQDLFGKRNHYESPGGGIEVGESMVQAVHREIHEELGYEVDSISYLASIVDVYNLLNRTTVHNYFVCYITKKTHSARTRLEEQLFDDVIWCFPEMWLETLNQPQEGVNELVHARERVMMRYFLDQQEM